MSAPLLLNPLLGAAPVDPARPLSSGDGGFAGVLAAAAGADEAPAGVTTGHASGHPAPAAAPATIKAATVTGLVAAAAGKDLTKPSELKAMGAVVEAEAELAQSAASPTPTVLVPPASIALIPPVSPGALASATRPVADSSGEVPDAPESPPAVAAIPTVLPTPAVTPQATAAPVEGAAQTAAAAPIGFGAPGALPPHAGPLAAAVPAPQAPPGVANEISPAPAAATDAPAGAPPQVPAGAGTTTDGDPVYSRIAPPADLDGAPARTPALTPVKPGLTATSGLPDASPARAVGTAVAGSAAAAVIETRASVASSPVVTDLDALMVAAPAAASTPVAEPGATPVTVPTAPGQAQIAATGAALAPKPAARRADAPATGEAAQATTAPVPGHAPEGAELPTETAPAAPLAGGNLALNGQAAGTASPPQAAATGTGAPVTAQIPGDATPAAILADVDAELSLLDAPTDLPPGESPRLPETPLPTASSIVLQTMVNDGRFNAVAQISAQILRRLESQTTRFELALTPEDLGRVDVTLEIDGDGGVTARLAFDNPAAAAELRAQADQLRRELEAAGLNVTREGLQFAERDARRDDNGTDRRGAKAFAGAARLEADADAGVGAYRVPLADGRLDVRI